MIEIQHLHKEFGQVTAGGPDPGRDTIALLVAGSAGLNQDDVLAD